MSGGHFITRRIGPFGTGARRGSHGAARAARLAVALLASLPIVAAGGSSRAVVCGAEEDPWTTASVLPRASREDQQRLAAAGRMVHEGRHHDAAGELQSLWDANHEDGFLVTPGNEATRRTLRHAAREMIGAMPAEGRRCYELRFGAQARALLEEAAGRRDGEALARVSSTYFHTAAGHEATLLLARDRLDRGQAQEALEWLAQLAASPAAQRCEPDCSLLLAASWLALGHTSQATEALGRLPSRAPHATFRIGEQQFQASDSVEQMARALAARLPGPKVAHTPAAWTGELGELRWRVPMLDEGEAQSLRAPVSTGSKALPAAQPLIVGGTILARTPRKLIAIESDTGRRVWEFPWEADAAGADAKPAAAHSTTRRSPSPSASQLRQRVCEDFAYGRIAGDGRRVFVLDPLGTGFDGGPNRVQLGGAAVRVWPTGLAAAPSRLVCLDTTREGLLRWAAGGEQGGCDPALAEACFLGAPAVDGQRLYALAEIRGELTLCGLDASTGQLEFSQVVARPHEPIGRDWRRRLAGATPALAHGVLICPTSAGAVVAVAAASRSLLWGYAYPRTEVTGPIQGLAAARARMLTRISAGNLSRSGVTLGEGCVLLAPTDSELLFCLDLFTGEERWSAQSKDLLYVAGVYAGKAILVSPREVTAVRLADRRPAWAQPLALPAEPCGRGLACGSHYYLPTSAKRILKIDLDSGRVAAQIPTPNLPGNLQASGGRLLCQSVEALELFGPNPRTP